MKHLLFFANSDSEIPSCSPIPTEATDICRRIPKILRESPDFLGLVDPLGIVLQFAIEPDHVWMEIPVPSRQGSFGKRVQLDEVSSIIEGLGEYWSPTSFEDLEFQSWG